MFQRPVQVNFANMLDDIDIPPMYRVHQQFDSGHIADVEAHTARQMRRLLDGQELAGKRIAVTAGSRGIRHGAVILRTVVRTLREVGAQPFAITAMGSHAGATNEGQLDMLAHLGITEETIEAKIVAGLETRRVGALADGTPVYVACDALDADGVIVVNKIKPHADFKGAYESGLVKMLTIGLGKHKGCSTLHRLGFASFARVLPEAAQIVLDNAPILGGVAILENAYDEILAVEALAPGDILRREGELLQLAKQHVARLKLEQLDVLVIDEIGKNISGEGMDPNVTGRPGSYLNQGFDFIDIECIVVRGISEPSAGNGAGIGMADITTVACANQLDLGAMYTNSITAGILGPSRLPVVLANDREAIRTAIKIGAASRVEHPRVARIQNTLLLQEIWVSQALLPELEARGDIQVLGPVAMEFDTQGQIVGRLL